MVAGAARAIDFYGRAFGAEESDKVGHAEFGFDGVTIMLSDEFPELGFTAPTGTTAVSIVVYVADVDALVERAVAAGVTLEKPVSDEFYGDRVASLRDPFGHRWLLHSRREIVNPEEMRRRMAAAG
ncbi:MAG: VOC family protein [Polyangiaceae bacterium]